MKVNMLLGDTQMILDTCVKHKLLRNQAAYVLATAYWETGRTMKPVVEAYWLSEAWRRKNLRYYPYHGRGYVQLTWKRNYIKAGKELGVDFVKKPQKLLEPRNSAEILVVGSRDGWFTGKKLSDYITLSKSDFVGARRIINGTDKRHAIASIAKKYDAVLKARGYGVTSAKTSQVPKVIQDPVSPPAAKSGLLETILRVLNNLLKG